MEWVAYLCAGACATAVVVARYRWVLWLGARYLCRRRCRTVRVTLYDSDDEGAPDPHKLA